MAYKAWVGENVSGPQVLNQFSTIVSQQIQEELLREKLTTDT